MRTSPPKNRFERLCALLTATVAAQIATGAQIPIQLHSLADLPQVVSDGEWRFDRPLTATNTTSNFIFDGVSSLLQQWGNTRYRNGHNIVPATIPTGTLLYRGSAREVVPDGPEWVATDPEHSFLFCREMAENTGCWHLAVTVREPLNTLYFDGSSAVIMYGPMDTQDLIVFGEVNDAVTGNRYMFGEGPRIKGLCEWGKKYGLDAFVRMQPDFELMLCDFKSKVDVSFSNLVPPWPYHPDMPPMPVPTQDVSQSVKRNEPIPLPWPLFVYRPIESGKWHDTFPGETRVQLDLTRLVSFYDTQLFPSLKTLHATQPRWEHRAANVSKEDRGRLMDRLDQILSKPVGAGSGVDWSSVYRVVIHRYAERLELLQYILLQASDASKDANTAVRDAHDWIATSIFPYILHGVRPPSSSSYPSSPPFSWAAPIFEKCATSHTEGISRNRARLTQSEVLLLKAVNQVLHEICRVMVGTWAEGAELGIDKKQPGWPVAADNIIPGETMVSPKFDAVFLASKWHAEVTGLMEWLDWGVWTKCRPACGYEETCTLPTWPWLRDGMISVPGMPTPPKREGRDGDDDDGGMYWKRPQPKCMRRLSPLEMPP